MADGLESDDDRAGAMIVCLVIGAHRPFTETADERIAGHFKLAQAQPRPFDFEVFQKRVSDIGDEVRFPDLIKPLT